MSRARSTELRAGIMAFAIAFSVAAAGLWIGIATMPALAFNLQRVAPTGDVYVLDHGLTADDCAGELRTMPSAFGAYCAPVYSTNN